MPAAAKRRPKPTPARPGRMSAKESATSAHSIRRRISASARRHKPTSTHRRPQPVPAISAIVIVVRNQQRQHPHPSRPRPLPLALRRRNVFAQVIRHHDVMFIHTTLHLRLLPASRQQPQRGRCHQRSHHLRRTLHANQTNPTTRRRPRQGGSLLSRLSKTGVQRRPLRFVPFSTSAGHRASPFGFWR